MKDRDIIKKFGGLNLSTEQAVENFRNFFEQQKNSEIDNSESVKDYVELALDFHKGTDLHLKALTSIVWTKMGSDPRRLTEITGMVRSYINANSGKTREDGKRYQNTKRKGIKRWSDIPVTADTTSDDE